MGSDDGGINDQIFEVWIIRHRFEDAPPHTFRTPATEAAENAVPISKHLWKIAPGSARTHNP
jgi:hypothetical protein